MAFYETRFPTDISYGSSGGPKWKTDVISFKSGYEQRNQRWSNVRNEYDVAYGVRELSYLKALIQFFNEMRGRLHGFRYKDWTDFEATDEALVPDGTNTVQLIRTYGNGFNNYSRTITKPVSGTVTMKRNGSAFSSFTLDTTTGIATLTPISSSNVSNVTSSSPGGTTTIQTALAHGRTTGDEMFFDSLGGVTSLNGNAYAITVTGANTFTIAADTSGESYTSGGTVQYHVQSTDELLWTGEFDIPCRFDTDDLPIVLPDYEVGSVSIPVVEIRV